MCTDRRPIMQYMLEVSAMRVPGLQLDFIIGPALRSDPPGGIQPLKGVLDPPFHVRFCRITIFKVEFRGLELMEKDLVRCCRQQGCQSHLGSMLRERSSSLLRHQIEHMGNDMLVPRQGSSGMRK